MKNLHIIPTEKPSRLHLGNSGLVLCDLNFGKNTINGQNIYITSEEKIKKRDWYFNPKTNKVNKVGHYGHYGYSSKKIILTTDQDLIADGVQAIDDEFLEWFVKNPSRESVEVEKRYSDFTVDPFVGYKIIIPQEEINFFQITVNAFEKSMNLNLEYIEEPKQETLEEIEKNIDREEWINFFKNNSKEEILEYLINYKFPL